MASSNNLYLMKIIWFTTHLETKLVALFQAINLLLSTCPELIGTPKHQWLCQLMTGIHTHWPVELTLWFPSAKRTFSQPFKERCISEVARIGSIIIFHLGKLRKAKFFTLCDVTFLVRLQGEIWSLLGVKELMKPGPSSSSWLTYGLSPIFLLVCSWMLDRLPTKTAALQSLKPDERPWLFIVQTHVVCWIINQDEEIHFQDEPYQAFWNLALIRKSCSIIHDPKPKWQK